jgi:DNA invertase Pin-like site-specific DNA recombinase
MSKAPKVKREPRRVRVVGYIRVSTEQQVESGLSLEAQRDKVIAYAALHDLELVEVIEDAGVSAKNLDRPGLSRALQMVSACEVDGLVVMKLDRLSRSVRDWAFLIDLYFGEKAKHPADLFSVSDSIDTRTAAGRLVLNVLMSVNQWEREAISERTIAALDAKKLRGERTGGLPLGRTVNEGGKVLVDDPDEAAAIARIVELRGLGLSLRDIAKRLDLEGIHSRGKRWHKTTIDRVLRRSVKPDAVMTEMAAA